MAIGDWIVIGLGGLAMLYGLSNRRWLVMMLGIGLVLFGLFLVSG